MLSNLLKVELRLYFMCIPPENVIVLLFPQGTHPTNILSQMLAPRTELESDIYTFYFGHKALTTLCSSLLHDCKGPDKNSVCFISFYEHILSCMVIQSEYVMSWDCGWKMQLVLPQVEC